MTKPRQGCCHPFWLTLVALCAALSAGAQTSLTSVGSPQNTALFPVEHGFVNLGNGQLHIEIPIANSPQRGDLSLPTALVYDSGIWQIGNSASGYAWEPVSGGWSLVYGANYGANAVINSIPCPGNASETIYTYTAIQWTDIHGTQHTFPFKTIRADNCSDSSYPDTPTAKGYATDASGYYAAITSYDELSVWDPAGTLVVSTVAPSVGSSDYSQIDRNGNEIIYGLDGVVQSDSMEHPLVKETVGGTDKNGAPTILYLDVPTTGSQTARYTINYSTIPVKTNFAITNKQFNGAVAESSASIRVVSGLVLPDGSSYSFTYDQACAAAPCSSPTVSYGLLKRVTLPHGGVVSYSFNSDSNAGITEPARWVSAHSGSDGPTSFTYTYVGSYPSTAETGGYSCGEIKNTAAGALLTNTYIFSDCGGSIQPMKIFQSPTSSPNSVDRFSLLSYDFSNVCQNGACTGAQWVNLKAVAAVLPSTGTLSSILAGTAGSGLIAATQVAYGAAGSGRVSDVKQWDYVSGTYPTAFPYTPSGNPKRETSITLGYTVNNALYPTDVSTKNSTGATVAEVQFTYDEPSYFTASPSGVPNHSNSLAASPRGNVTTISKIPHGSGYTTAITGHIKYDDTGAVVAMTDGNNNTTSISHDSTDTYPQTVTRPPTSGLAGHSVSHVTQTTHDFNTGATLTVTDENSQVTTYGYDSIGRLGTVKFSNAGSPVTLETFSYPSVTETDGVIQQVNNSYASATIPVSTFVDGYGRPVQSVQAGVTSETSYNAQGLVQYRTNAHTTTAQPTDGKASWVYDELGRVTTATLPSGKSTTYKYSQNTVTITDPLQHQRQQTFNAFGDLTSLLEPNSAGALAWLTNYIRTDLGCLSEIDQEGGSTTTSQWRQRYFTYDAFGRLATQKSQEAGQYSYTYDANGNLLQFANQNTSANTVAYTYDALNRVVSKNVGGGPTYKFTYDAQDTSGDPYGIGRLTGASDGVSVGALYTHDPFGHIASEADSRPSNTAYAYKSIATYDYLGNLLTLTYPDGRTMAWVYDLFNRPTEEVNTLFGTNQINVPLMISGTYFPTGQLQDIIDGSGVELTTTFDPNGDLKTLTYNNNGTNLVARTYSWADNGKNLLGVTDSAAGRTQTFTYDQVDRLLTATDTGSTSSATNTSLPAVPSNSETFTYDPWGNLTQTGPYSFGIAAGNTNQIPGYTYDSAGNMTKDGLGNSYSYRADGHQTASNGTSYSYDPLDNRAVKAGSTNTEYFYFGGTLIASRNKSTGAWNDIIYGANGIMGEVAGTAIANPTYRLEDHLGTLAQTTDDNGNVLGGMTSQPFGQILNNTTGDGFLLTEHDQDTESASIHTQFRQYSPTQGRWLSPDPSLGSYDLGNPQSFNRYVYALNSPMTLVDATGLDPTDVTLSACPGCAAPSSGSPSGGGYGSGYDSGWSIGTDDGNIVSQDGFNTGRGGLTSSPSGVSQRQNYHYSAPGNSANSNSSRLLDWTQTAFRVLGAIPEIGIAFNAVNTGIDLARGNYSAALVDGIATLASVVPGGAVVAETAGAVAETAEVAEGILAATEGTAQVAQTAQNAIGATGKVGEDALKLLGGESQAYFPTSQGARYVDQLVNGAANESKVGYTSLTSGVSRQISKDVELINTQQITGSTWHFFESPVTGLRGPSQPLLNALQQNGINVVIH